MIKRFFALILVLALAMSCVALADGNLTARSATVKVTVQRYEITKDQLTNVAKASEDPVLATYYVDYGDGQAKGTTWALQQSLDDGTTWTDLDYTADPALEGRIYINASDITYDGLATKVQVKAIATLDTPGGDRETESVTLSFVIIDDDDEDEDPWSKDDDDPGDNDNDDEDDGGIDDQDKKDLNGLIDIEIKASLYETMDGDKVTVSATPTLAADLKTALGVLEGAVYTTLYIKAPNSDGASVVQEGYATVEYTFYTDANLGRIYKFWAVGELAIPAFDK